MSDWLGWKNECFIREPVLVYSPLGDFDLGRNAVESAASDRASEHEREHGMQREESESPKA